MTTQADGAKRWLAQVYVSLKPAVNDPQGLAVRDGLHMLGYDDVDGVRVGKYLTLTLSAPDQATAEARVAAMCEQLLANPVMERYDFHVSEADGEAQPRGEG